MANCKFCGKKIVWLKEGRKNIPVEEDGTKHECEEFKNARDSARTVDVSTIDPEILKQYEQGINKKKK